MDYMLSAEHIHKKYGGNSVLRDVSIHVEQGGVYGLIGRNGSGKTTLLRILAGLIRGYDGTVTMSPRSKLAAIIHDPALFLNMSAAENLKEQACLLGIRDRSYVEATLAKVGLDACGKKAVMNFSLGMKQRLKLALALLEKPDVLILDEPVNGLDPDGIAELRELLLRLNRNDGITILISSHILSELEQTASRFGILHDGVIVKEMDGQDVLQSGKSLEEVYLRHTRGGKIS